MRTHQEIDQRSRDLHRLIADKLRANPDLFARVGRTITRWQAQVSRSALPYLDQWAQLFEQGMDACLAVAEEDSQRADALRQCSPFTGILTNEERFAFFKSWPGSK
jgi:hypothetical protein